MARIYLKYLDGGLIKRLCSNVLVSRRKQQGRNHRVATGNWPLQFEKRCGVFDRYSWVDAINKTQPDSLPPLILNLPTLPATHTQDKLRENINQMASTLRLSSSSSCSRQINTAIHVPKLPKVIPYFSVPKIPTRKQLVQELNMRGDSLKINDEQRIFY